MSDGKSYHDYFIRDGKFIGRFEDMYKNCDDPWEQSTRERWRSEKTVALGLMRKLGVKRVLELGCGLGYFTEQIASLGVEVLGVDVSETAVQRARELHPGCQFRAGDILDAAIYREFKPELILMAEITWCVLDKLDAFLAFFRKELPSTYLIHLLNTYPPGVQKYGREKFTNLEEIKAYFKMNYLEWGEFGYADLEGKRTYFLGRW
jgi:SAM-dependent methyltransferase